MTSSKKLSLVAAFIIATAPSIGLCYTASDLDKLALTCGLTVTGIGISGIAGGIVTAIGIDKVCTAKKIKDQIVHSQPLRKSGMTYIKVGTGMMLPLAAIIAANAYNYSQMPSELKQSSFAKATADTSSFAKASSSAEATADKPENTPKDQTA